MKKNYYFLFFFISLIFFNNCQKSEKARVEDFLNESFLYFSDSSVINNYKRIFADKVFQVNSLDNFDTKIKAIQDSMEFLVQTDFKRIAEKNGFVDVSEYDKAFENYKNDRYISLLSEKLKLLSKNNSKELQKFSQYIIANKLNVLTGKNYQDLMGEKPNNQKGDTIENK